MNTNLIERMDMKMSDNGYTIETRERLNEATRKLKVKVDHYRDVVPLTQAGIEKCLNLPDDWDAQAVEENWTTATEVLLAVPLACQLGKQTLYRRRGIEAVTLIIQLDDTVEAVNNFEDALRDAVNENEQEKTDD
jgi:hypothetical protein